LAVLTRGRYELGGTPLPFASDGVFERLWPAPTAAATTIGVDLAVGAAARRTYTPGAVPKCARCGGQRAFECQLMPNLINAVKPAERDAPASDAARVAAVRAALEKGEGEGMEWGTVLVFTCADDCCEGAELFAEEEVLVQWDE
jgi:pre-rRNA-processing protein TSR4